MDTSQPSGESSKLSDDHNVRNSSLNQLSPTPASGGLLASIQQGTKLRPSVAATAPVPVKRASIFDDIKSGTTLRHVEKQPETAKAAPAARGLLDTLAVEMFKRRMHVQAEESDSEASGFSDSSSDSD